MELKNTRKVENHLLREELNVDGIQENDSLSSQYFSDNIYREFTNENEEMMSGLIQLDIDTKIKIYCVRIRALSFFIYLFLGSSFVTNIISTSDTPNLTLKFFIGIIVGLYGVFFTNVYIRNLAKNFIGTIGKRITLKEYIMGLLRPAIVALLVIVLPYLFWVWWVDIFDGVFMAILGLIFYGVIIILGIVLLALAFGGISVVLAAIIKLFK